ncbi:MAG TPA: aminotransferase class V-fold PLP-dependent enzyme [Gemmatimonadaceae bacterium]|nr:aminotransferase class V-fold PLP-dependent enzyme [Gemmatimonadaceae bacterium]
MRDTGAAVPYPQYDLAAWRRRIPLLRTMIPMNNCSQGPLTDATRAAAEAFLGSWDRMGMDWDAWVGEVEEARRAFAALVGASHDEIAVCSSVSQATSIIASALDWSGDRNVVVPTEAEFPTVGHVWLAQERRGARVVWVPAHDGVVRLEDFDRVMDQRTLLVSACHGCYESGFKQDVAAIARKAHDAGALVFIDAYQTLGTCPVDVKAMDADFLVGGTLKYLMGTAGIAFLYVRSELIERLRPTVTGWFGRREPFAFRAKELDWAATARRFDGGTPPVVNAYIARAGIGMIAEVGVERIASWTEELSRRLIDGGQDRGLELYGTSDARSKTPTTAFRCPGDSHAAELAMRERGVLPSARGGVIRLAPHFYSTLDDVDTALDLLADVLAGSG